MEMKNFIYFLSAIFRNFDFTKWLENSDDEIGQQSCIDYLQKSLNEKNDKNLLSEPKLGITYDNLGGFEDSVEKQTETVYKKLE